VYAVTVAHPYREMQWCCAAGKVVGTCFIASHGVGWGNSYALKNAGALPILCCQYFDAGGAILAFSTGIGDMSTQLVSQQVHPVADSQDRQAAVQDSRITEGRLFVIDARWTT